MVILNSTLNKMTADFIIIVCCLCNFLSVFILFVLFYGICNGQIYRQMRAINILGSDINVRVNSKNKFVFDVLFKTVLHVCMRTKYKKKILTLNYLLTNVL